MKGRMKGRLKGLPKIDAYADPGEPGDRGPAGFLWWLLVSQRHRALGGAMYGTVWMVLLTLPPYFMSRAIDDGLVPGRMPEVLGWTAVLLVVGSFNAWVSIMRHRTMTRLRMDARFRVVKVVMRHAVRLGAALPRQAQAGEVVTVGVSDVQTISNSLTMVGPGVGAVVAYLVVAGVLTAISAPLAAVILLGLPLMALLLGPLLRRLQGTEGAYRERMSGLTARIGDLAGGLRVLNGLGGKELYADGFRRASRDLREQGYRVGSVTSWVQALGTGLPTLFLALVTWLAARLTARGDITVGQLVSVYGYVAVLVGPVAFFIEGSYQLNRGLVAARRIVRFLALEPAADTGTRPAPDGQAPFHDPASGVEVAPGRLTALVSARPADSAEVVDRFGRFGGSAAVWGGVRLDEIELRHVRARVLVADNEAELFAGTLRDMVSGRREHTDSAIARALHAAVAEDIVQALPDGLDSRVDAQGRSLSGGQRQRVRLARALLADPEVLLAVEPTSALDAHTEAAVAARLHTYRQGRTTVVTGTSPLLLERADAVYYLVEGRAVAVGTHRELLDAEPGYRALVARDSDVDAEETVA
jgi:ABC-type multidrug transport system fused ATPase/permease subunit